MRNIIFLVWGLLMAFTACKNESPGDQSASSGKAALTGHQRMISILDSIAVNADPQQCYNLNTKRAEFFRQQLENVSQDQRIFAQFKYAEQLLYAGKNEAAMVQLKEIIQILQGKMEEGTKIVYELLALCYLRMGEQQNCIDRHTA